jgi:hypothetical protein
LTYHWVEDTRLHYFTVPSDGVYFVHAMLGFMDGVSKSMSLCGRIEKNSVEQMRQFRTIGGYTSADYMFLIECKAKDTIRFTALQNSGTTIKTSEGCRFNIIRL